MSGFSWKGRVAAVLAGVLCLVFVAIALAVWQLPVILNRLARPYVEARHGALEVSDVEWSFSQIALFVRDYSEPGLSVRGLRLTLPWFSLFSGRLLDGASVHCEQVEWTFADTGTTPGPTFDTAALVEKPSKWIVAAIVEPLRQLDGLPAADLNASVETLRLRWGGGHAADARVALSVESHGGSLAADLRLSGQGLEAGFDLMSSDRMDSLKIDYSASLMNTEIAAETLDRLILDLAREYGFDIYPNSLEGSDLLGGVAGYLRWDSSNPEAVRMVALGNFGSVDLFAPEADWIIEGISVGLAVEAAKPLRAYLAMPLGAGNWRGWSIDSGDLKIALKERRLLVDGSLQESAHLRLESAEPLSLLGGNGGFEFTVSAARLDGGMLSAFWPGGFSGWELDGRMEAQGRVGLKAWSVDQLEAGFDLSIDEAEAGADRSLGAFFAQGELSGWSGSLPVGDFALGFDFLEAFGMRFGKLDSRIYLLDTGVVEVADASVDVLGGQARIGRLKLVPDALGAVEPTTVELDSVDLSRLAELVPQFRGEVSGAVSGELVLGWEGAFILEGGELRLDDGGGASHAHLSYPVEGLFTRGMEPGNPSYRQYRMAEQALEDLSLSRLRIEFFPADRGDQPIRLRLYGESDQADMAVPIDFTLNVNAKDARRLIRLLQVIRGGQLELSW